MADTIEVLGAGSPIVDLLTYVPEDFLARVPGEKGGMELVDAACIDALCEKLPGEVHRAPGGAAANTIQNLAKLGVRTAMLGMLGRDEAGTYYQQQFADAGCDISRFKIHPEKRTAQCLSLITPDAERTMRTDLGAAAALDPASITVQDFVGCNHLHLEGYLLFNPALIREILQHARTAGCRVSLDLGSFEIVKGAMDILPGLLTEYVDAVFANEEEAAAYLGADDPVKALNRLAEVCDTVVVKLGKEGALLKNDDGEYRIDAVQAAEVKDTTGAGDLWASGFLYGWVRGYSLELCGRMGAVIGCEAVQHTGACLPPEACRRMADHLATLQKEERNV